MIPQSDIEIVIEVDLANLSVVTADQVVDGLACIHEYESGFFGVATWANAQETIQIERDELERLNQTCEDEEAFDEAAFEAQGEHCLPLEFGVSGVELRLLRQEHGGLASLVSHFEAMNEPPILAVDVPIGLPTTAGLRVCDREARTQLGRRWMCVFPAPDRKLFSPSFEEARALVLARRGPGGTRSDHPIMSKQTIAILPKIEEVDSVMRADLARQEWIVEVHPEVCFTVLAKELGHAVLASGLPPKRHTAGRVARLGLLQHVFSDVGEQAAAANWPRSDVGRDDVLDAYAALWSAGRYASDPQSVVQLGGNADDEGLLQRMVA